MKREDIEIPLCYRSNAFLAKAYRDGYMAGTKNAAVEGAKMAAVGQLATDVATTLLPKSILEDGKKGAKQLARHLRRSAGVRDYLTKIADVLDDGKDDSEGGGRR